MAEISVNTKPKGDDIIHQQVRLKIMASLNALGTQERCDFTRLRAIVETTDGNLATHLVTLEEANYVRIEKDGVGSKRRTRVAITPRGRRAFAVHIEFLRSIIADVED